MFSKIIKNDDDHNHALEELGLLMDKEPKEGSPEAEQIELLTFLIRDYEDRKNYKFEKLNATEAIKLRLDEKGLRQKDLAVHLGSEAKVSLTLSGKRRVSSKEAERLGALLGIPLSVLSRTSSQQNISSH